jgi:hypothetical protein
MTLSSVAHQASRRRHRPERRRAVGPHARVYPRSHRARERASPRTAMDLLSVDSSLAKEHPRATLPRVARRQTKDHWAEVDAELVAWRITSAVARIQTIRRCGYRDALLIVRARYEQLRQQVPERFTLSPEDSWEGFRIQRRSTARAGTAARLAKPQTSRLKQTQSLRRARGERRIVVEQVAYYWRIPPRANTSQEDHTQGVCAVIRQVDSQTPPFVLAFPQLRMDVGADAEPVRPADIANAIRALLCRK